MAQMTTDDGATCDGAVCASVRLFGRLGGGAMVSDEAGVWAIGGRVVGADGCNAGPVGCCGGEGRGLDGKGGGRTGPLHQIQASDWWRLDGVAMMQRSPPCT